LLGLVEGLADFAASSLDYVAGWLSDYSGRRKAFALAGYVFSTAAKIILLVASSVAALCYLPRGGALGQERPGRAARRLACGESPPRKTVGIRSAYTRLWTRLGRLWARWRVWIAEVAGGDSRIVPNVVPGGVSFRRCSACWCWA